MVRSKTQLTSDAVPTIFLHQDIDIIENPVEIPDEEAISSEVVNLKLEIDRIKIQNDVDKQALEIKIKELKIKCHAYCMKISELKAKVKEQDIENKSMSSKLSKLENDVILFLSLMVS